MTIEFQKWPSIGRLSREMVVTEKLDGTNAAVVIGEDGEFAAQSRTRLITPEDDNYGFARWAHENRDALTEILGPGRHFGEWWGQGIQRKYGMDHKRFSLFNVARHAAVPAAAYDAGLNMDTVPVLYVGDFDTATIDRVLGHLSRAGSKAAPGFMRPEGVVVYHSATNSLFKKTIEHDEMPKSLRSAS